MREHSFYTSEVVQHPISVESSTENDSKTKPRVENGFSRTRENGKHLRDTTEDAALYGVGKYGLETLPVTNDYDNTLTSELLVQVE